MPKKIVQPLGWEIENEYSEKGYTVICGTDEAGRGPLCGPVAAGACILPLGLEIPGLNDSKKLSEKKREALYEFITHNAISWAVELVSPEEIDEMNILNASQTAMKRAIAKLAPAPDLALVDGNVARNFPCDAVTVVKGDAKSPSIAAASILAKVTRDRVCLELDAQYPEYGIAKHKGYPTKEHMEIVKERAKEHGVPPIYRKTFLKFL